MALIGGQAGKDNGMRWIFLSLGLVLAACGGTRPLAEGERALAADMFGDTFNPDRARVTKLPGAAPDLILAPEPLATVAPRPGVCDRIVPNDGPGGPPPAFVLYERMNVQPAFYRADLMEDWPGKILVPESLHMTHGRGHI